MTAPTGSGKTLAAFLWALDQLICQQWTAGTTRVLYVSPLKALNNDVQRNLIRPLEEIRAVFGKAGVPLPALRVATRSGDTPASDRRKMLRHPPEILITTPESLHIMSASRGGLSILGTIKTVILDEIHAVAGNRRGTLLMSAVERLVPHEAGCQRIALSATVNPEKTMARFVGGFTIDGQDAGTGYSPRPVVICRSRQAHRVSIDIRVPDAVRSSASTRSVWKDLAATLRPIIDRHRSCIVFTNSRRLCEKLTFLLNGNSGRIVAYAHHGSLSKELRLEVEQRLKRGDLKAIVATTSLELGIDIGTLDRVILVQSPPSISSALQRIGRSGHGVGETSRASFFCTHGTDTLSAAILAQAVRDRDVEPIRPIECPLDVLAQIIVAMTALQPWNPDRLYTAIRCAYAFRNLQRTAFDRVVDMLAGRYAGTRVAALKPKLVVDRIDNTVTAKKGAILSLYTSGGVIPDRGYFALRNQRTGDRIGELDEEFVWEARNGQVFTLGTQNWRIRRITANDVWVQPAAPDLPAPPFWRAEAGDRDYYLSERITRFLETAEACLTDPTFADRLVADYGLDREAAAFLIDFLIRQRQRTGCPLPHRRHMVIEWFPPATGSPDARQAAIHTFWGGRVNRPYALALEAAWQRRYGGTPSVYPGNDAVYLIVSNMPATPDIVSLVAPEDIDGLLKERLEGSEAFGARFRECAARALLLPRTALNRRTPLWLTRQRSRHLLSAVESFEDFPILLEAWRTCLQDEFDMPALRAVLSDLQSGAIACSQIRSAAPSPMALSGAWRHINHYMYADDRAQGRVKTKAAGELFEQVVFSPHLRPAIAPDVVADFELRRQRLFPGYPPDHPQDLLEWVKERHLVPVDEWERLMSAARRDRQLPSNEWVGPVASKLLRLTVHPAGDSPTELIVAAEMGAAIAAALYPGRNDLIWTGVDEGSETVDGPPQVADQTERSRASDFLAQWLRFYGPTTPGRLQRRLGLDRDRLETLLEVLIESRTVIAGRLIVDRPGETICCADNYETLLRMARTKRWAVVAPRPIDKLGLALAHHQGLTRRGTDPESLADCLSTLIGLPLPAGLWETEVLPARLTDYRPQSLDRLVRESSLMWVGQARHRVLFCLEADLDLISTASGDDGASENPATDPANDAIRRFPDRQGRYRLSALLGDPPQPVHAVLDSLWSGVWSARVANDTMTALRQMIDRGFKCSDPPRQRMPVAFSSRSRHGRHRRSLTRSLNTGTVGNWYLIDPPPFPEGRVERDELIKDRARLLLDRYGILFRQLLARELKLFRWPAVFRALRLMELAGEVVSGCFFDGIPGPQFVSQPMLRLLGERLPENALYWISALDPASTCGLAVDGLKGKQPRRSTGTHMVYRGSRLIMVSRRNGKTIDVNLKHGDVDAADSFIVFDHMLERRVRPLTSILVETINGIHAARSPWLNLLRQRFDITVEMNTVTLYRKTTVPARR
jgi:ATP-dependent Lhr-like helicase